MTPAITSLQAALDGANHERSRELIREALQYEEIHINEWLQTVSGLEGVRHIECDRDGSEIVWFDPDAHFDIELTCSESKPSELFSLGECPDCGSELTSIESVTPTEVL